MNTHLLLLEQCDFTYKTLVRIMESVIYYEEAEKYA